MKRIKYLFAMAMVLCLAFGLCACGESGDAEPTKAATPTATVAPTDKVEATPTETPSGMVTYKVTVVDEGGNPIVGAMVQICKDACLPAVTNDSGVAEYTVADTDGYKVSFLSLPAGYTYTTDETEFYFEEGSKELTITLKAEG